MSRMHRLYGVTMPEKGISQLVSVDLQKAEGLVSLKMEDKERDFKTRLKIEKNRLEKLTFKSENKKGLFLGNALKLGTELVAAVVVGTIIGFILDIYWFGAKPILIIIFFLLVLLLVY